MLLLCGPNIKALIKKTTFPSSEIEIGEDSQNSYTAILAWFGEIPNIKGVVPFVEQIENSSDAKEKNEEECEDSDDVEYSNSLKSKMGSCTDSEDSDEEISSSVVSHIHGYVWWADENRGVMRIYQDKGWAAEFVGILFNVDVMHFEGEKVDCEMLHNLVAHLNKCNVVARKIPLKHIHGMTITWKADHIECGQVPHSWLRRESCSEVHKSVGSDSCSSAFTDSVADNIDHDLNIPSSVGMKQTSVCLNADGKVWKVEEKQQSSIPRWTDQLKDNPSELNCDSPRYTEKLGTNVQDLFDGNHKENDFCTIKDLRISYNPKNYDFFGNKADFRNLIPNEYIGKHLTGHIIKLFSRENGFGIAQWKSMDYGCVNIIFKQNDLFVDLIPVNKIMQLSASFCDRCCNLYVLPIEEQNCSNYKVKLAATCGWLGAKPLCIPTPGEQPKAKVVLEHLKTGKDVTTDDFVNQSKKNYCSDASFLSSCKNHDKGPSQNNLGDAKFSQKRMTSVLLKETSSEKSSLHEGRVISAK